MKHASALILAAQFLALFPSVQGIHAQEAGVAVGAAVPEPFLVAPTDGRGMRGLSASRVVLDSGRGDFSIFESKLPAGSPPTPLHRHTVYDEGFLVLDGTIDFVAGDKTLRCGPGCFAFIPRGVAHGFSNAGVGEARMWVVGSSGVQAMVEEVAPLLARTPPNIDEVIAVFARHKSELVVTPAVQRSGQTNE